MKNKKQGGFASAMVDFLPLALFFIAFKKAAVLGSFWIFKTSEPIIFASFVLAISTALSFAISFFMGIEINKFNMISSIVVVVFSMLTVVFNNPQFIKMKLTLINAGFAIFIYIYCLVKNKSVAQLMFAGKIEMPLKKWLVLDRRFFYMFWLIALANEFCWRGLSTQNWVIYKVFIVLPLMLLFFMGQMPFLYKYSNLKNEMVKKN